MLVQKLMYGEPQGENAVRTDHWNQHESDVRRLTEHISKLPKWPKLVTWQVLNLNKVVESFQRARQAAPPPMKEGKEAPKIDPIAELRQAPILYISGDASYRFTQVDAGILRAYVDQGGFILGMANCPENGTGFEQSFRDLIAKMYPQGEATLQPLTNDHLVFRSEYPLKGENFDLLGVDVGCRTAIMFSKGDLGCLWNMIETPKPEGRSDKLAARIERDTRMGVNIIAYATGREPPNKLDAEESQPMDGEQDHIERGFLQIAKLKHSGSWDVAPRALKNLLMGLNQQVGRIATTKDKVIAATDPGHLQIPAGLHARPHGLSNLRQRHHPAAGSIWAAAACCLPMPAAGRRRSIRVSVSW